MALDTSNSRPQDPRLPKERDQNNIFDEPDTATDVQYQAKARGDEEGFAHQMYQNNPVSTQVEPQTDFYSQTTVQEIPQQAPASYAQPQPQPTEPAQTPMQKIGSFFQKNWIISLLLFAAIAAFAVALFLFLTNQPQVSSYQNVTAQIEAPATVANNGEGVWKITVENTENVDIENAEIALQYDKTFTFRNSFGQYQPTDTGNSVFTIPLITAGSTETIEIAGTLAGDIDELTFMSGTLTFAVGSGDPIQRDIDTVQTTIALAEVELVVSMPTTIEDQTVREITVEISNQSERDIQNTELRVTYPSADTFEYQSSELQLSSLSAPIRQATNGNNVWAIDELPKLRSQSLTIRGQFFGAEGTRVPFQFQLVSADDGRVLAQQRKETQLAVQPMDVSVDIRGKDELAVFRPGERLQFDVQYINRSSAAINNVVLTVDINDPANVLDFSSIRYLAGDGNLSGNSITFRGSGVDDFISFPAQSSGELRFVIKVKDEEAFSAGDIAQDRFVITPSVSVVADSVDEISTQGAGIKSSGDLGFEQTVDCIEETTGSETTCTVQWAFNTRQTNIANVQVETTTNLPPSFWEDSTVVASQGEVNYNPNTGMITWDAGRVQNYAGLSREKAVVTFELVIATPEGGNTTLFSAPRITGEDEFTGETYNFTDQTARL